MSKRVCVNAHNRYRRQHGVPDVAWDPVLARAAKRVVDSNAANNVFAHSSGQHPYGENIDAFPLLGFELFSGLFTLPLFAFPEAVPLV